MSYSWDCISQHNFKVLLCNHFRNYLEKREISTSNYHSMSWPFTCCKFCSTPLIWIHKPRCESSLDMALARAQSVTRVGQEVAREATLLTRVCAHSGNRGSGEGWSWEHRAIWCQHGQPQIICVFLGHVALCSHCNLASGLSSQATVIQFYSSNTNLRQGFYR